MSIPKCLVLDIETFQILAAVWDIKGDQYINHKQVKIDWAIAAWSAKWLGESAEAVVYADLRKAANNRDDKAILTPLRNLIDKADFIMTQNGKNFDWPKIQARLMLNKITPPSYFQHIDLYKEYKSVGFTSHSLEYLTDKFCVKYKKLDHSEYPGNSLWDECEIDNKKAWEAMKKYNINDVLSLEELYQNTCQWLPKVVYKLSHPVTVCHKCGGKQFGSNGVRAKEGKAYIRKFCKACGEWQQEELV